MAVRVLYNPPALTQTYATADGTHATRTANAPAAATAVNPNAATATAPAAATGVAPNAATSADFTDSSAGTPATTIVALPDPTDTPADADTLRDDLVAVHWPILRNWAASFAAQSDAQLADIASCRTQITALVADNADLRTKLAAEIVDAASLRTQLTALIADVANLRTELTALRVDSLDTSAFANTIADILQARALA